MSYCFAADCNHNAVRDSCTFYRFPKEKSIFNKWSVACRRADREPTNNDRLCSCHFVDSKKENGPSIFKYNENKRFMFTSPEKRKRRNTEPELRIDIDAGEGTSHDTRIDPICSAENYFLSKENEELKEKLKYGENRLSLEHMKNDDTLIFRYTGLPTAKHFHSLSNLIKRFEINYVLKWSVDKITLDDQLLCLLMKLRLNLANFDLAYRFKVSAATISNIVITFLHVLHKILFKGMMDKIPSREKNELFLPACFAPFPHTRIVLDCTEIEVAIPSSMKEQKAVFSHYKQRHTFKALIGVAPNGTITYVSDLYPGSMSDKRITEDSKILSHMVSGDMILCDKGFLINDLCAPLGVKVNRPPFLYNKQFSEEEVLQTQQIARARIHVERAIGRLKSFRILHFIQPCMREHSSKIVQTCAALVNLQCALLSENEQFFKNESSSI